MAKKDQQSSWNSKRFKAPKKNNEEPVPEIQGKKQIYIEKTMNKWQNKTQKIYYMGVQG